MRHRRQQGIGTGLTAIRTVYQGRIDDTRMLRALTSFDDAKRDIGLAGAGEPDANPGISTPHSASPAQGAAHAL